MANDSKSIYKIFYFVSLKTFSFWNFILPIIFSLIFSILAFNMKLGFNFVSKMTKFVEVSIGVTSTVFALTLAFFTIGLTIYFNERLIVATTASVDKASGYKRFKLHLINMFKPVFWLFNSLIGFTLIYAVLLFKDSFDALSFFKCFCPHTKRAILTFVVSFFVLKSLFALKVFIFNMYTSSLKYGFLIAKEIYKDKYPNAAIPFTKDDETNC